MEHTNDFKDQNEKAPTSIGEVVPIEQSRNMMARNREHLRDLVEGPLLSACEELYDKNVQTLSASANGKDIERGAAYLIINFDSLSDENKEIGRRLGEVDQADGMNQLVIQIPIRETSTTDEVRTLAESIAHKFQNQEMTWAPSYTLEQMREMHGVDPHDETYGIEAFSDQFHYDPKQKLFYQSEEHARKSRR